MRDFILLRQGSFYLDIFCATAANCPLKDRLNLLFLKDGVCGVIWFLNNKVLGSYWLTASVTHRFWKSCFFGGGCILRCRLTTMIVSFKKFPEAPNRKLKLYA